MTAAAAYEHNGVRVSRERFYAIACDPRRSVAVEACAGAGKTWMLVSRIVRALLEEGEGACAPHEILAITFTKKAAGEMRERLDQWLERFAEQPAVELVAELVMRGMDPSAAEAAAPRLQGLYRELLAGGRPVQFRTFHAWFAALLRSAPVAVLERLRLPANYQLLEDDAEARVRVWRPFYSAVTEDGAASADYHALVATHGRSQIAKALDDALTRRVEFALADAHDAVDEAVTPMGEMYPAFARAESPEDILLHDPAWRSTMLAAARALGRASAPTFSRRGVELEQAVTEGQAAGVLDALLTQKGEPRKFSEKLAGLEDVRAAQERALQYCAAQAQHEAWLYQQRMARLTRLLNVCFMEVKATNGWVDMNDVEQAAHLLLGNAELWGWVQERLDAQVRHLLVDEFQDTNPLQWQALNGWLGSYAGAGGRRPGVFIVGDPKQSIYRFRRAEPQVFIAAKQFVQQGLNGDLLNCDHTHRNAQAVVGLVNAAMQDAQQAGEFSGFRNHTTESRVPGQIRKLPLISRDSIGPAEATGELVADADGALPWRDSLTTPRVLPEERLLQKECEQAARWIAERIAGGLAPSQIMVLARRRSRLAVLQDELRKLHIAVQQPEKNDLNDAPEVQDVVALIDALVSPDHDLSLARALKSPLWGADDDALVQLALRQRAGRASWFDLLQAPDWPEPLAGIGPRLRKWQQWLAALPPHDALSAIFHDGDALAKFAAAAPAALRKSVLANLRGLLAASLELDGARFATAYGFVRAVRAGGVRAPSVAVADAVQLLTVHGAKGLEAELVLLLDTDASAQRAQTMGVLVKWPGHSAAPERFVFMASEKNPPACTVDDLAQEQAARHREEINALYVATTRARGELVVSAVAAARPNAQSWWARLEARCTLVGDVSDTARVASAHVPATFQMLRLPEPMVASKTRTVVLAAPDIDARASAMGQAMHRLLEWAQPGAALPVEHLRAAAREFSLDLQAARAAAALAQRIRSGKGAWAWDSDSLDWHGNEVTLVHEGQTLRIDRLVRHRESGAWWVLDYKSAARPERDASLIAQLNRYRDAVQQAYPGETVRAAFLTGQGELVTLE
ncbi:UvrD-helicase domain-containing protein [Variovorax sp. J22P240]|uniref:UvrD-helicase domain-containing protein n=1 Tax=Variovorax sp. J22P240 TaxID=3053514 RepID=UPI002578B4A8|nr:UvrD-helicase domain-containing protein [Variovorax sp. J22P240]MDL9997820.1 UvrD-helicase domain-containing protein [Variovorax sp. J22P240]